MARCKACDVSLNTGTSGGIEGLCKDCGKKRLSCRVCSTEFFYQDILEDLPVVQCPSCEGRAIDVFE